MKNQNETVYLTLEQAQDLVDRIADRVELFDEMCDNEKEAMAQLLSKVGVKASDLVDVKNLADSYVIHAELVDPEEVANYTLEDLEGASFTWQENGKTHYCLGWLDHVNR